MTLRPTKALSQYEFYILLALSRGELYAYAIINATTNDSMGHITLKTGTLHPLLGRMITQGLITKTDPKPAGISGQERSHYDITSEGKLRVKEELLRLRHTIKIAEAAGYFDDEIPTDIQRILNQLKD